MSDYPPLPSELSLGQAFRFPAGISEGDAIQALIAGLDRDLVAIPPEQQRSWFLVYRGQIVTAIIQSLIARSPLSELIIQLRAFAPTLTADELLTFAGVAHMLTLDIPPADDLVEKPDQDKQNGPVPACDGTDQLP